MSDMRYQISERVIARNEAISFLLTDCHAPQAPLAMTCGIVMRPALGIGASCRAARKARPAGERPNDKALKTKRKFNGVK